eukprot:sb/3478532/
MVEDTEREIERIAEFLGVKLTDGLKERVLHEGKFETMQRNDAVNYSWAKGDSNSEIQTPFIRQGKVGGWRGKLSEEQERELDKAIEKVIQAGGRVRCTLD